MLTTSSPPHPGNVPSLSAVREAPPSYNSLFGQIQNARLQTRGKISFLKRLCQIVIGTGESLRKCMQPEFVGSVACSLMGVCHSFVLTLF